MTPNHSSHISNFISLSIWYLFLIFSILNLSLLPSENPDSFLFKPQNLIIAIEILWFLCFLYKFNFSIKPMIILIISGIPLILLTQLISTWVLVNDPYYMIHVNIRTLLKQIRDPVVALTPYIFILGLSRFLKTKYLIENLVYTLTFAVTLTAILQYSGVVNIFSISYVDVDGRGFAAGFSSPNSLGAILALIAPWTLCLLTFSNTWHARLIIAITFILQVLLLWITESRGSLISLILGLSIQWISSFYTGHSIRPKFLLHGVALVLFIFLAMAFLPNSPLTRLKATQWRGLENDLSTQRRYIQLNTAIELFTERPLLGWGFGGFQRGYERSHPNLNETTTTPHNIALYIASQAGAIGLMIYFLYNLLLFIFAWSLYMKNRNLLGGAIFSFPFTLIVLELFFPYSFTHDVGFIVTIIQGIIITCYLNGGKNA